MAMLLRLRRLDWNPGGGGPSQSVELRRCLKLPDLVLFGVASVVGAGIFVTVGVAGREAGPGLVAAFALAGGCCAPTALCYAELATRFPFAGSIYSFVARSMGDYFAFIVGFSLMVDGTVSSAAVAKAATSYSAEVLRSLGYRVPPWVVNIPINAFISISFVAPLIVLGLGYPIYKGVKTIARCNNAMTLINMSLIMVVIVAGTTFIETRNYSPLLPNGLTGVQRAAALSFFAMLGFDAATSLAEETLEPERVLPRAILWTVAITSVLYMAIAAVFCGLVGTNEIDDHAPLAAAFRSRGAPTLAGVIAVGAVGNTTTTLLGNMTRLPRFMLRMASDGHLPKSFAEVDAATSAPTKALMGSLVVCMCLAGLVSFTALVQIASVGGLVGFSLINASVLFCRCRPLAPGLHGSSRLSQDEAGPNPTVLGAIAPHAEAPGLELAEPPGGPPSPTGARGGDVAMGAKVEGTPTEGDLDDMQIESRWEDPSGIVVELGALVFTFFMLSLALNFALVLGVRLPTVAGIGLAMGLAGGAAGRCYFAAARDVRSGSEEARRIFLTPLLPWLPLAAMVMNNFIIANLPISALVRFVLLELGCGSCIYFVRLGTQQGMPHVPRPGAARRMRGNQAAAAFGRRAYAEFEDFNDDDVGVCTMPVSPGGPTLASPGAEHCAAISTLEEVATSSATGDGATSSRLHLEVATASAGEGHD